MRVIVDTNVFISAALKDKSFPALALHVVTQRGTLLRSTATERQLFEVLARPQIATLVDQAALDWMRDFCRRRKRSLSASASPRVATRPMTSFSSWR
jgi:predicted nucleic acid-binding protein